MQVSHRALENVTAIKIDTYRVCITDWVSTHGMSNKKIYFLISLAWVELELLHKTTLSLALSHPRLYTYFCPRSRNMKIDFVHLIFHVSRLSLYYKFIFVWIELSESNSKDTKRNTILTDLKILGILAPTKMLNIHILKYPHLRALYGVDIMLEKLPDDQVQVKILV